MPAKGRPPDTTARQRLRRYVLARDGWECQIRLPGTWVTQKGQERRCLGRATSVHHTKGWRITGDDPQYLVAACMPCNQKVGDPSKGVDPEPLPFFM